MIKNKTIVIKIIFKTYLKMLKTFYIFKQTFVLQKLENNFQKLFSKLFFRIVF